MLECRGCIEKIREPRCWVEDASTVCCDCAFPTPEERQQAMLRLCRAAEAASKSLRDRFAAAALTGLLAKLPLARSDRDPDPVASVVTLAFEFADKSMEQRLPQK